MVTTAGLDTQPKQPTVEQTTDDQTDSPGFGTDQRHGSSSSTNPNNT
ncbi:MAG: hypothetical protein U5J63_15685 [Fodinibius sp.]|nr:hypothetical protein [Fodinibius sp.]